jgi:hypothetical protein
VPITDLSRLIIPKLGVSAVALGIEAVINSGDYPTGGVFGTQFAGVCITLAL